VSTVKTRHSVAALGVCAVLAGVLLGPGLSPAQTAAGPEAEARDAIVKMTRAIQEENDGIRNRMFFQLRILGEPAVAPLIQLLDHEDPKVAGYAAHTLSFLNENDLSSSSVTSIVESLMAHLGNREAYVRSMSARALGRMEKPQALDALMGMTEDASPEVRQDVAWALGWIRDERALPALERMRQDQNDLVRFYADEAVETIRRAVAQR
jgi:HEAT repeat protein